jgi:hypothetical protein
LLGTAELAGSDQHTLVASFGHWLQTKGEVATSPPDVLKLETEASVYSVVYPDAVVHKVHPPDPSAVYPVKHEQTPPALAQQLEGSKNPEASQQVVPAGVLVAEHTATQFPRLVSVCPDIE